MNVLEFFSKIKLSENENTFFFHFLNTLFNPVFLTGLFLLSAILSVFILDRPPVFSLLLPIGILIFFIFFKYPEYLFFLIVVMIPLDALRVLSQNMPSFTITKLGGVVLFAIFLFKAMNHKEYITFFRSNLWFYIFSFFLIIMLSLIVSPYRLTGIPFLKLFIQTLFFTLLSQYLIITRNCIKGIKFSIIIGTTLSSFLGIYGHIFRIQAFVHNTGTEITSGDERVLGGAIDPNEFAVSILFSVAFLFSILKKSGNTYHKLLSFILLAINITGILLSNSRAGILILILVIIYEAISVFRIFSIRYKLIALLLLIPVFAVSLKYAPETSAFKRMSTLSSGDESISRRKSYYIVAFDKFLEKPFLGWGISGFPNLYAENFLSTAALRGLPERARSSPESYFRSPHNSFVDLLISAGILGSLSFMLIIAETIRIFYKSRNNNLFLKHISDPEAYIFSFIIILMGVSFISNMYHKYIWLIISLALAINTKSKANEFKENN